MADLAERSLNQLLAEVADATPAPGGGSSAGWTCAIAAALVEMAAAITLARGESGDDHLRAITRASARARELRAEALGLAEGELHAYAPVLVALRLPNSAPGRGEQLAAALSEAAQSPLALARCAAEIAALGAELHRSATLHVRGDALAGLLLSEGACQAAARLARINLAGHPDDDRWDELDQLTTRAASLRAQALSNADG